MQHNSFTYISNLLRREAVQQQPACNEGVTTLTHRQAAASDTSHHTPSGRYFLSGITTFRHPQALLCTLLLLGSLLLSGCVKDMQDELNEGDWNHERSILSLKFENQVGQAVIERIDNTTGEVRVTLNVGAIDDLSKVTLESIILSYQGTASVAKSETLDFSNPERKADITVTSPLGESRTYTVYVNEFRESLEGTWKINNMVVYGGTGPEYGGGRVYGLMDKSWCWYPDYSPAKEYDNSLTFTLESISDEGNTMGTCVNDAGPDGKYADFIFKGSSNPETHQDVDKKDYYRRIPEGESQWLRNYAAGTITFTDQNGRVTVCSLEDAGTYDMGHGKAVTVPNQAFLFNIGGVDDWTYIFTDYDVFVKKTRKLFIMVTKEG